MPEKPNGQVDRFMTLRVYELAKELGTPAKDLLAIATKVGIEVKGSFGSLNDAQVKLIKAELKKPGSHSAPKHEAVEPAEAGGRPKVRRIITIKKNEEGVEGVQVRRTHLDEEPHPEPVPEVVEPPAPEPVEPPVAEKPTPAEEKSPEAKGHETKGHEAKGHHKVHQPHLAGESETPKVKIGLVDSKGKKAEPEAAHAPTPAAAPAAVVLPEPVLPAKAAPVVEETAEVKEAREIARKKEAKRIEDELLKPKKALVKARDRFDEVKGGAHKNIKDIDIEARDERPTPPPKKRFTKFVAPNRARKDAKVKHTFQPRKKELVVGQSISVGDLAGLIGVRAPEIIKTLINLGMMATITQLIDGETAALVAAEHQVELKVEFTSLEDSIEQVEDKAEDLVSRPPVVTIMGHVDHGKTSLLDRIRQTNVTQGEAGGITQHIGAYNVKTSGGQITFLDTPGHEAFTAMRARGANVTDIVVLVVAADDGPKPQTIEAIHHAKAAQVPIIVAINKIDKPGANADKVKQELMSQELVAEDYGGETAMVPVSAHTGEGLDKLMEIIQLQAEMMELKANPAREAKGVVIESRMEKGRGNVATILIQNGTLHVGDNYVVGAEYGRVRAMWDDHGRKLKEALPSVPVEIVGLNGLPKSGDQFIVGSDEKQLRAIAAARGHKEKDAAQTKANVVRLENLFDNVGGEKKELNLIIKTDVVGSMEAISESLGKLGNDEVSVRIIHAAVGAITRTDVVLASASKAIVIGFNIRPDAGAKQTAQEDGVQIRLYSVIYDAIEDVTKALEGLLKPIIREELQGKAEILEVFNIPKVGVIAGSKVTEGKIIKDCPVRVIRDNVMIHDGKLASLRRFKENAKEVAAGFECGIGLMNFKEFKAGDVIECYKRLETSATL